MSLADLPGVSEVLIHVAIVVCLGDALGRGCCSGPAGCIPDVLPILSSCRCQWPLLTIFTG